MVTPSQCDICLENVEFTDRAGFIPCCKRKIYHKLCLLTWSLNSNSCPNCRNRYTEINVVKGGDITVNGVKTGCNVTRVAVQDKLLPNSAIDDIPPEFINPQETPISASSFGSFGVCSICSSPSNLLNCQCGTSFHHSCLSTNFCPFCDEIVDERLFPAEFVEGRRFLSGRGTRGLFSGRSRARGRGNSLNSSRREKEDDLRGSSNASRGSGSRLFPFSAVNSSRNTAHSTFIPRRGLVIHNDNNELDDSFLDQQDLLEIIPTRVVNGGTLLRKELMINETLTKEESNSWKDYENLRTGVEPINCSSDGLIKRRRRRKKITPISEVEISAEIKEEKGATTSRISSLINQLKGSKRNPLNKTVEMEDEPSQIIEISDSPPEIISDAQSPQVINLDSSRSLSPLDKSLIEHSQDNKLQYENNSKVIKKARQELTLDHKMIIQKIIRNCLRPLYSHKESSRPSINTEEEYIRINKAASHKIYQHILRDNHVDHDNINHLFAEANHDSLIKIIEEHITEELKERQE